jgi:curved DNA-binding protein CbpA
MNRAHYETLNIPEDASDADIRQAYKRAAKEAHPDREGGDADRMSKINQAYNVLGHAGKRAHYDSTGEEQTLDSLEIAARKGLYGLINQALGSTDENANFVETVLTHLELNRQKFAAEEALYKNRIKNVAAHKRRLKRKKKGANVLLGVFEEKQRINKAKLANATFTLKCIERGIEMMQDYETVFEEAAAMQRLQSPFLVLGVDMAFRS